MSIEPGSRIQWGKSQVEDSIIGAYYEVDGAEYLAEYRADYISIEDKSSIDLSRAQDGIFCGTRKFGPAVIRGLPEQQSDETGASRNIRAVQHDRSTLGSFVREPSRVEQSTNPSKLIVTESENVFIPDISYRLNADSKDFDSIDPILGIWAEDFTKDVGRGNEGYFLKYVVKEEGNAENRLPPTERWRFAIATLTDPDQETMNIRKTTREVPYSIDGKEQARKLTIEEVQQLKKTYEDNPDSVLDIQRSPV